MKIAINSVKAISNQGFLAQKCQESQEIAQYKRFFIKKIRKIHLTNGSKSEQLNRTPSRLVHPLG